MDILTLAVAKNSVSSTPGQKGDKGDTGAQGIQGIQGKKGDKGETGDSAYEIAKKNGFVGTEEEWLESLKVDESTVKSIVDKVVEDSVNEISENISQLSSEIEDLKGSGTGATTEQLAQIEQNKNDISNLSSAVAVERERINQFTKLEEGSTTGDAELTDARVDYRGNTHANVGNHLRYVGNEIEEVDKQVILSTNVDVVPFRNSSLANGKVYSAESESFYFFCIKGHTYKWTSDGNRQDVGFFFEIPSVGKPTYNSKLYQYSRNVEFEAPITGYCMVYHNSGVSDEVAESAAVTTKNNIDELRAKDGEINEFIDELYGQISNGVVLTTRLSGYNLANNKITANNSESFYFKVFKGVSYKFNDSGSRQNIIFTKEKPQEGVIAYDNTTYSYPRDVEFIAPITGYCVIHHNHIIDDNVAQSVEVKVMNTLVDKCKKDVLEALGTGGLKMLPDIYEFVDELHGQLSDGTVLTTRLSGYNFAYNKITVNNSESFYFKVFKDVAYKFNDDGTRQNVIFVKERPQEGVVAYDNTTHSYPRGVAFIAPITGYCVIHHHHVVDDSVAQSVQVNVADTLVDQCEDNVLGILEANDVRTLPSIYLEEIARVGDIVANQDFGLSFLFATDIHIRDEAHLYKMDIMGKCGEFVDLIILNGDIVDGSEKEDVSYVKKLLKATIDRTRNPVSKTYALMGNHDNNFLKVNANNDVDSIHAITTRMFTNLTCKGETNAVYDSKHPMQVYYYIDFPMYKIRMICLNVCLAFEDDGSREDYTNVWGFTTDEMYWMRDKALRFDDKEDSEEWGVVLCSHISILRDENVEYHTPKSITFTGMMSAFQNGTSYTEPDTAIGFGTDNVFDFSDQGGREVICYLAGHLHYDLVSTANDLQIPIISTTSGHASQSTLVETQTPTTPITTASAPVRTDDRKNVNSECFDIVKIDRQKRKIICTRYGAGNSREIDY